MSSELAAKQAAGLGLLGGLKIDFDGVHEMLSKVLENIVTNPDEPKYRKLRTTNEKIKSLLSALGAKQLLIGSGFVEEAEFLVFPDGGDLKLPQRSLDGLRANQKAKAAAEEQLKKEAVELQRVRAMAQRRAEEPVGKVAQAKASHILLNATAERSFEENEKRLAGWTAILEDAPYHNQEHDFGELAKAHSDCPSGARGGALGFFPKGKMVEEFDAVCFEQKTKAIYGPVRTATGSHLIFLHARIEK